MRDFSTNSRENAYIVEMFYHNKILFYCQFEKINTYTYNIQ